jgi:hypothetical protein
MDGSSNGRTVTYDRRRATQPLFLKCLLMRCLFRGGLFRSGLVLSRLLGGGNSLGRGQGFCMSESTTVQLHTLVISWAEAGEGEKQTHGKDADASPQQKIGV